MNTHCYFNVNINILAERSGVSSQRKTFSEVRCAGDQRIKQQQLAQKKYRAKIRKSFLYCSLISDYFCVVGSRADSLGVFSWGVAPLLLRNGFSIHI